MSELAKVINELRGLQRRRSAAIQSRIMQSNRLVHTVARFMGYESTQDESVREKHFAAARAEIKRIGDALHGKDSATAESVSDSPVFMEVLSGLPSIEKLEEYQVQLEKQMLAHVKKLPVAKWAEHKDQRGFGLLSLAIIVGEAGDLGNYANPAKLWKRFGCAPYQSGDQTLMGSTWKSGREGKLKSDQWEEFGYSPRRRSIIYVIGESLLKLNQGPYRSRYDEVRAEYAVKHPDRVRCSRCDGSGKATKGKCVGCKGTGIVRLREHRHAMLLMCKRLLRDLWAAWHDHGESGEEVSETERANAALAVT